jgi:uncharacterized protein YbjT (DUF2867 family)
MKIAVADEAARIIAGLTRMLKARAVKGKSRRLMLASLRYNDTFVKRARFKGAAEKALLAAGFPRVYIFRPAYIYPVEPRKEPTFGYRLLRGVYAVFRALFPNLVVRSDELGRAMVDVSARETEERESRVFENREIVAMISAAQNHKST